MPKRLEIISLKSALQIVDVIPVVTVDGPSGSGKGMVATHLAAHYGFRLLDSGALYRLVGIAARWAHIDLDLTETNHAKLSDLAENLDVEFKPTGDPETRRSLPYQVRMLLASCDLMKRVSMRL